MLRSGFSLLELLISIAIVAVLAAVLVVATGGVREKSNSVKCAGNLRSLSSAMLQYVGDNGRYPCSDDSTQMDLWFHLALPPYLGDADRAGQVLGEDAISSRPYYFCPAAVSRYRSGLGPNGGKTYSMNVNLNRAPVAAIERPSKTMMLMDGHRAESNYWAHAVNWGNLFPTPVHGSRRQPDKVNAVFCDGHVEMLVSAPQKSPAEDTAENGFVPNSWSPFPFWRPGPEAPILGWR